MARAVMRNTFLEVVADVAPATAARSRSLEPDMLYHEEPESRISQLSRLSAVFGEGRRSLAAPDAMAPAAGKLGLMKVQSNSSVSTMAPSDWCDVEDDEDQEHAAEEPRQPECTVQAEEASPEPAPQGARRGAFSHSQVPRTQNLAEAFLKTPLTVAPTTVMIRNIPNRYSQKELIAELEALGFVDAFDFLYLPIDTGSMGNVGYAFVNFREAAGASRCFEVVGGHAFRKHQQKTRTKVATVSVAHLQGLEANLRHYERAAVNSRGRAKRCGPVVLAKLEVTC